ncbi:MAG: sortase [Clostridium sp.]|nr:sortase [Clostridium sp.]
MNWRPRDDKRHSRIRHRIRSFRFFAALFFLALAVFAAVRLAAYYSDLAASRRTAEELRSAAPKPWDYKNIPPENTPDPAEAAPAQSTAPPNPELPRTETTAAPIPYPSGPSGTSASDVSSLIQTTLPPAYVSPGPYPGNPGLQVSSRFRLLRLEAKYLVGWLTLGTMLDEPVAQRDQSFFLDHDAKGKKNANGSVFLDDRISLETRPPTLVLYGHNMKSGHMFGCLRNYEDLSVYKSSPFITFDTMYEDGRYVVFAVSRVSTDPKAKRYLDAADVFSENLARRQKAIDTLLSSSVYYGRVGVAPEDQLLLLVTCMDDPADRRIVAARRLREGETERLLEQKVKKTTKK